MITYEVTAGVRADLVEEYEPFMRTIHIPGLLATGCFSGASFGRSAPGRYRIRYEAYDRAALDRYLAEHAPRLRAEVDHRFPSGITLSREVWDVLEAWERAEGGGMAERPRGRAATGAFRGAP